MPDCRDLWNLLFAEEPKEPPKALNQAQFTAIVSENRTRLAMHAACVVGAQEAEDVVQTALLRAWRGMDTFKGQANPLTWLTTIVIRTACDKRRTQKRQEWQVSDDALWVVDHSPTPDRAVQARHDLNVVMETIPASQRYLVTHEPRQSTTLTRQERETKKLLRKKVSSQFESSKFI